MANSLNIDLMGKHVVVSEQDLPGRHILRRIMKVDGGFGAHIFTSGGVIGGMLVADAKPISLRHPLLERLATDEEVAQAMVFYN